MASNTTFKPLLFFFETLDRTVEVYLRVVISPFLKVHEKFYSKLNTVLRDLLDSRDGHIPLWFTANFITYLRTLCIIPCLQLLSWGHRWIPILIVLLVDFGDFLDGVVARYWIETDKGPTVEAQNKGDAVPSWLTARRNSTYGGFIDAICDKAFVVPCWIYLLSLVSLEWGIFTHLQHFILWCLIFAEVASGSIRFRAYYTAQSIPAPIVSGLDFSTSAVKADHIGKAKQTFEMVGTALFMLPYLRILGIGFLILAVPLSYESVRRKVVRRVIYVQYDGEFNHAMIKFWMQAKCLGSRLIVGVTGGSESIEFLNASAVVCVDKVIPDVPSKVDVTFLSKHNIDFFVCQEGKTLAAGEGLLSANQCLAIGEDGKTARAVRSKPSIARM